MPLRDRKTGKKLQSLIEKVITSDYDWLNASKEFSFDWTEEGENEVYKIFLVGKEKEILGVMSLVDYPEEYRIHLNLIEVSSSNIGKKKKIENIAGCLIAFACQLAFMRGYYGFVSLQPKTRLIDLYQDKYGFRQYGRFLAVEQKSSTLLMDKYLDYEEE